MALQRENPFDGPSVSCVRKSRKVIVLERLVPEEFHAVANVQEGWAPGRLTAEGKTETKIAPFLNEREAIIAAVQLVDDVPLFYFGVLHLEGDLLP